MKTFPITEGPQFAQLDWPAETIPEVNRRLPEDIRWSPVTRELVSDHMPIEERRPMTGSDIDWSGMDQQLGEESSLTVAAAILIEEVGEPLAENRDQMLAAAEVRKQAETATGQLADLARAAHRAGVPVTEIAERAGVTRATIYSWLES